MIEIIGGIMGVFILILLVALLAPLVIVVAMIPLLKKVFVMREERRGEALARGFRNENKKRY